MPAPKPCIGRETDIHDIVEALLDSRSHAVVILGAGGIGKTTASIAVLRDSRVLESYKSRYFAECEGAVTVPLLLSKLASAMGVNVDRSDAALAQLEQRNVKLQQRILQYLRSGQSIVCIDNFETPWEDPSIRLEVENLLRLIIDIPTVAVLVTMRGTEAPFEIDWALRHTLRALSFLDSFQLFMRISGKSDDFARNLVEAAGGHPLALSILAHLAQASEETTENLWKRWQRQGTSVASRAPGVEQKSLNLDDCFNLSLTSHRMVASPQAREVLALTLFSPTRWLVDSECGRIGRPIA